ncbi:hypothetical protein ACVBEH_18465 [Roseateles sp. GG27B]
MQAGDYRADGGAESMSLKALGGRDLLAQGVSAQGRVLDHGEASASKV